MATLYYIDGYNVIHFSSVLKPIAMRDFEAAREALIEKVATFCAATGHKAKIIFDGRGHRTPAVQPMPGVPGLKVIYSHGEKSADAIIERTIYKSADRRNIIVVSGDRGIRSFCQSLGALVMEPDNFIASVRSYAADARASMSQMKRPDTQNRLENRMDEDTLSKLRHLRDDLESGD
ncbi:MAG: hypothetical protein GWP08_16480 [Nitrospiraceae bacterium]|nr:hypothetical protein [Nitrospiraceae bacterium]